MSTAGCTDQLPFLGDEPLEFSANPASVPDSVLDKTGYDEHKTEQVVVEETFEATGQTQDVIVTNWEAEYDKAIDLSELSLPGDETVRAAVVTVLTTPQVHVLGQTFNPVADMESEELAEMVQDQYEGLEELEQVGEESVPVAGEPTTVGKFEGQAQLVGEGISIDLTLHITEAVESNDDFIVGVGGYPTRLREQEQSHVFSMLEEIEHDE
ncbi:MAG: DUF6517 family protein [Halapricum sp.]